MILSPFFFFILPVTNTVLVLVLVLVLHLQFEIVRLSLFAIGVTVRTVSTLYTIHWIGYVSS